MKKQKLRVENEKKKKSHCFRLFLPLQSPSLLLSSPPNKNGRQDRREDRSRALQQGEKELFCLFFIEGESGGRRRRREHERGEREEREKRARRRGSQRKKELQTARLPFFCPSKARLFLREQARAHLSLTQKKALKEPKSGTRGRDEKKELESETVFLFSARFFFYPLGLWVPLRKIFF